MHLFSVRNIRRWQLNVVREFNEPLQHRWLSHGACVRGQRSRTLVAMKNTVLRLLPVREGAANRQTPNPSIEGTSSSGLRPLPAAPHVKR